MNILIKRKQQGRSREGAWIEISVRAEFGNDPRSRSREGAWIEIIYSPH